MQGVKDGMSEISNVQKLKARFRTWKNVLLAAGLPSINDPDEKKKRLRALNSNLETN